MSTTADRDREDIQLSPKPKIKSPAPGSESEKPVAEDSHTFIARFWLEKREIKDAKPIWRGVVEHVASGQRRYLQDLDEVKAFLAFHLQENGIWSKKI